LKNKAVHFHDDNLDDGGGIRFLYPLLGEELALRVPLEVQTLQFADQNVLTREYFRLNIRGTMKWRIVDIRSFYLTVSRQLRKTTDDADEQEQAATQQFLPPGDQDPRETRKQLLRSSIEWLRVIAEAETRDVISRISCGLLLAERVSTAIPELAGSEEARREAANGDARTLAPAPIGGFEFSNATEGLGAQIHRSISEKLQPYGIAVEDVALQEVGLPEQILEECINACRTAYLPLVNQRKATGDRAKLQAQVDLLGRDYVGTREVVSVAKARLPDFIETFMKGRLPMINGPHVDVHVGSQPAPSSDE
jgi:regulator of protease activity HflC (stomatin/prohibitin superfamily)